MSDACCKTAQFTAQFHCCFFHTIVGSNCFIVLFRYQGLLSSVHIFLFISCSHQMFLTVYLSNNDQHFTEVPITPETLCRDVVELCKEPGETDCHLSEMWRGSGNLVCLLTNSPQWCMYFQSLAIFNCGILLHLSETFFNFNAKKAAFLIFLQENYTWRLAIWSTASFLSRLISSGLQHKCCKAHNLCNKHGLQAISHISQVESRVEISFPSQFSSSFLWEPWGIQNQSQAS